jgi:hypothetical protein
MAQSVDELKLPPRPNLRESGLQRSERIKALQQKAHTPTHVKWGSQPQHAVSAQITLFSFVSYVTIPDHALPPHATFSDRVIKSFEEIHEHYDGTMNQIHFLSFSTDITFKQVFTYKKSMSQEDTHLFIEATQKEVADHELHNHWTVVPHTIVPKTAKLIQAIWSFKQKQHPDGTLVKHKARLYAHGGMQQWGTNYWEIYSPVVNMVTVGLFNTTACPNIQT